MDFVSFGKLMGGLWEGIKGQFGKNWQSFELKFCSFAEKNDKIWKKYFKNETRKVQKQDRYKEHTKV